MFKILRLLTRPKSLTWVILLSFMMMINGCYYFKVIRSSNAPPTVISKMQEEQKFIILHLNDKAWHLSNITIEKENINGIITDIPGHEMYKKVKPDVANRYRMKDSLILNEVHIYTTEFTTVDASKVSIPIKAITKIEIYKKDTGATIASWVFSGLGVIAGTAGIVGVIILLTKSSCPFVYAYNGKEFVLTGEIFSGAVQPKLERDDYLLLPSIVPTDGTYKVKITNEVKEIQWVNLVELLVIDHPSGNSVLIDKNGIPYSFKNPSPPVVARGTGNCDILPLIASKDSMSYIGNEKETDKTGIENIVLKFIKPKGAQSSRLIIRAKNSFWLEGLMSKTDQLFGGKYNTYWSKQEKEPGEKMQKWFLDQKMPLSVYIERDNDWKFVDYFNFAGPIALKDDILPMDLTGINSDTIKIKLVTGFLFWEIDYVAMDFSKNEVIKPVVVPIVTAIDNNNFDIKGLLLNSDNDYYIQNHPGDEAVLTFLAPLQGEGARSVFLHTRGHYKILREQTGKSDKKKLRKFRKPDRYPEFSKEMFDSLLTK